MGRFFFILLFALIAVVHSPSQVLPKEGSSLNYRIIGFSFSPGTADGRYKIEVAKGHFSPDDAIELFKKNIVVSTSYVKDTKIIIEVPFFGTEYTWRVVAEGNNKNRKGFHHFSTTIVSDVDTSRTRLRVLQKPLAYKDAFVFLDGTGALYDMDGQPVWYLPDLDSFKSGRAALRELKTTPQNTLTFMIEERAAYEVNFNGDILWRAPNNGSVNGQGQEHYHHEFTRLANGHYMILGSKFEVWNQQMPSATDSSFTIAHDNRSERERALARHSSFPFGTVIEYDEKGNVVWSWKSTSYFRTSDIYYHKTRGGRPEISAHENSFYFDEKEGVIYVGFRNLSRIIKLKYPEGNVLATYGEVFTQASPEVGNGLYCRQHGVRRSDRGYLYLYNNNVCPEGASVPQILKLEEPASGHDLKKIWEYDCTTEGASPDQPGPYQFPTGGNVIELPDHSMFVNMSTTYSKVFILDEDKKILWSAIPEKWNEPGKRWLMVYDYRASIITDRKQLEKLIWSAEEKAGAN